MFECHDKCKNEAICDPVTKSCLCPPGYKGTNCESKCAYGYFGKNCNNECRCKKNAACDHITGHCECSDNDFGRFCEHSQRDIIDELKGGNFDILSKGNWKILNNQRTFYENLLCDWGHVTITNHFDDDPLLFCWEAKEACWEKYFYKSPASHNDD